MSNGQGQLPLSNTTIPTISAAVATSRNVGSSTIGGATTAIASPMEIVQQKFKDSESVLALFEAYQIVGIEHSNRLIALVVSTSSATYALFSMHVTRLPPRNVNDITFDKIFPLNNSFQFQTDKKTSMSHLQFDLQNDGETPVKFYYYPITSETGVNDFETFQAQVKSVVGVGGARIQATSGKTTSDTAFNWINDYRQIGEAKVELKRREREYIVYKDHRIYCATWNVNNQIYRDSPLHLWLAAGDQPPDIYAIGFQELDTSPKAFVISRPDPVWRAKLMENLHEGAEYEELTSVRLVGMMLTIIVRKKLRPSIRYGVKTVARGFLGQMGNKGAVAVSMQLNEANICFVNSHLAAHMNFVDERNQDYAGIVRGCIFDDNSTINDHDHIFWIGDLNYRIEEPPGMQLHPIKPNSGNDIPGGGSNSSSIYFYSPNAQHDMMLTFDQLQMEMRKGNCFNGYNEGDINFRPTYKYDVGTDNYDSQKQRAPAWCDRILWKGQRIQQITYNSIMEIKMSDHKPVYAIFTIGIKTKDEERLKRVLQEVLKLVDKRENENQPQITVEKTVIDFGLVQFNEMAICDFTVANNCHMPVEFSFKKKDPPIDDICEKWLNIEPRAESLMIDTSKSIRVKLLIDSKSICSLLKKIQNMDRFDFDILILHVKNGPDIFITVTGEYKPSCFGLSIETLCRTNRPICDYNQTELQELLRNSDDNYRVTMPREFFLLIDYLHKMDDKVIGSFMPDENLTQNNLQMNEIRDWIDSWSDNEFPGTPQTAAEALVMLLDLPDDPLLHPYCDDLLRTNTIEDAMDIINLLSAPKRNVFAHLCMFLRAGVEKNYYNLNNIAILFGRVLLRDKNLQSPDSFRDARCRAFIHRLISSDLGTSATTTGRESGVASGKLLSSAFRSEM